MLEFSQFTGPIGGLLCIAFAMGCIAGWGFAMRLMAARISDLREECATRDRLHADSLSQANARITAMDTRLKELDDFLLRGMDRQLNQVRASSESLMPQPDEHGRRVR